MTAKPTSEMERGLTLLARLPVEDTVKAAAIRNLKVMAHNGELRLPEPWEDAAGNTYTPWNVEKDGSLLACYLDMLGLA